MADDLEARKGDIDLSDDERAEVSERAPTTARVLHEVVRSSGDEELNRPTLSLIWSGLAGGVAIQCLPARSIADGEHAA